MQIARNLEEITKYNFEKFFEKNDPKFLIVAFDDRVEKKDQVYNFDEEEVKEKINEILHQYSEETENRKLMASYKRAIQIDFYKIQEFVLDSVLEIYNKYGFSQVFLCLEDMGLKYTVGDNVEEFIKKAVRKSKSLKNKINLLEVKEKENKAKGKTQKRSDMHKDAIILSMNLELGYKIDVRKTSMLEWVKLEQLSKEKSESYGKS